MNRELTAKEETIRLERLALTCVTDHLRAAHDQLKFLAVPRLQATLRRAMQLAESARKEKALRHPTPILLELEVVLTSAVAFANGEGVQPNPNEALELLREAAGLAQVLAPANELLEATREVVQHWEHGDLAGAARRLNTAIAGFDQAARR